jgi:hypothetical protein
MVRSFRKRRKVKSGEALAKGFVEAVIGLGSNIFYRLISHRLCFLNKGREK